ncbi:DUF1801 domain-containing protein [Mucilaginibacter mali]|uniref:DUF1801 domain-containing protein n=1 Tax=Mucilaginibacter mali TaxID=2740462 RepID=A0A7D4UCW0_9SPHI|nr:DUF1801 domain-containing protein [Mucilaginibacter mali]QKJ32018.1 DUF1801 domain-containing protein [Mucilaginibacter mali]
MAKPIDHNDYIRTFPQHTQELLQQMRQIIPQAAPGATEVISYSMPAFKLHGKMLVWFAGYERHIGFYPGSSGIAAFQKEISVYKNAKGSVQFPLTQPLPGALISRMVQFKVAEIAQKLAEKKK